MSIQILKKYNKSGPRYTSYPPATFFHDKFGQQEYIAQLKASNEQEPKNISLYFHVPFCPRLCHFCGCNTSVFKNRQFVDRYINAMISELRNVANLLDTNRLVTQVHWGGGTPNSIAFEFIERVMNVVNELFILAPFAEIAMECSPAYLTLENISQLRKMGFNRLSLGIQDFDDKVLEVVNRAPSKLPIEDLVAKMRDEQMEGVNLDLIYGLPGQTVESFKRGIERVIQMSPERLVTFSYAHVPWVKSAQKILEEVGLPTPEEKLAMFEVAYNTMLEAGYVAIGMDHYAKPTDSLSTSLKNKKLHRNFQGYCTKETTGQVYGFGSTSISQLHGAYSQNIKDAQQYIEAIEKHGFAITRGYELTQDEIILREVINEIMCNGYFDFDAISEKYEATTEDIIKLTKYKPEKLQEFINDNLLEINGNKITLKPEGFFVVRNIAMEFDPLLEKSNARYSKTV